MNENLDVKGIKFNLGMYMYIINILYVYYKYFCVYIYGQQKNRGRGKPTRTPNYHFHPLHEHLDIDRAFTEKNPLKPETFGFRKKVGNQLVL